MLTDHPMIVLALLCLLIFAAVWLWQNPGIFTDPIQPAELDRYMAKLDAATLPETEKADLKARLREWAAADDGRPVFMLNLMRFHDDLRDFPGAPAFSGTPQQSNAHYEQNVMSVALKGGAYPLMAGSPQGRNTLIMGDRTRTHDILTASHELDHWGRVIMMRYPNRRAFLKLVTSPKYLPYMPYKLMALQVVLVPVSTEITIPELRWLAGGLLLSLFLAIGWLHALIG